ncbi:Glucose-6-phosphate 1-dehydrogenase [Coemansia sp. RSA 2671]|uniref:Glucose-6-phosphate 1-dehydrogenase n=1 Tax=Coemansia linderi TaxID=2663919 RepID=A0ACC1KDI3_9FUNG|nr:Glucose-6-phosphate 1-dehydrogenase [Coemansia sp. RSA 2675]KAJ2032786.1 Glucose-6-phosphate 1-dehydrogenase [Coemansia sp. S610]KAJ2348462.1 Glucose-6-phosphate 1-dehydrogenase [Coemansia sp. RSA 2671]KAJ2384871.1 Glucose-6-phosphate 1-dehydrogenase [Coemansia sp. RSA 2611]KAJ2702706.1 Glucose-6-phosphate 1-dehydrogenase [Coemansia sp. IMI 209128]KAJ2788415.1 Glucose-6-phosphate 1-dehydrogenase [Coemansia linderi]
MSKATQTSFASLASGIDRAAKNNVPTTIVVFGASGDLAKKKTFPALFHLFSQGLLPKRVSIVGYARTQMSSEEFHKRATSYFSPDASKDSVKEFLKICTYVSGKYDVDADFKALRSAIDDHERAENIDTDSERIHVYYMALPPSVFVDVAAQIKRNVYDDTCTNRLIIEKPFGHDLESSRKLSKDISALFDEAEVFRIDHYLGKEMVKNILSLRFANVFYEAVWNRHYISNIQITFKEPFGTEGRGGYFDEFGIIRDVMQNHLIQVLCIVAMNQPQSLSAEDVRDRKTEVLSRILPLQLEDTMLGQYVGTKDGSKPGYKDDKTVPKDSITPTFAQCVLHVDNDRWRGVPWVIKAGKALDEAKMLIRIQFKDMPNALFPKLARNELVIQVSPKEAVYIKTIVKEPGLSTSLAMSELDLTYKTRYHDVKIPDAYATLILDVLNGDHSNFVRSDELDEAWRIFTPLLHQIETEHVKPLPYEYGSKGPEGVYQFVENRTGYKRTGLQYHWEAPQ